MKVKFKDLMNFSRAYETFQNEIMPLSLAYSLSKLSEEVNKQIEFYQKQYNTYLQLYAEKNEDGTYKMNEQQNGFILKKDLLEEAQHKFAELDSYDFVIDQEKIPLDLLTDLKVSPQILSGLLPFIE